MTNTYTAPVSIMHELNNLFLELTAKNCNQRCKHCYIDFPFSKNVKDFLPIEKIKEALNDTTKDNIKCIYLVGAEPMTHPDFNSILRLCLKRSNVCIFTNGSFINEKKARFLKRVQEESDFEIIFQLSIDHYNELKNDDLRGRGSFRQVLHAIKSLVKYEFNPIICTTNYYKEDKQILIEEFKKLFSKIGFEAQDKNFKINTYFDKSVNYDNFKLSWESLDCEFGRILTNKGIYSCPFLANDHRGRSGGSFKDYSNKMMLESDFCATCLKNSKQIFGINYKLFEE